MYDHFIGIDWAQTNMAIARLTSKSEKPHVIDVPSDVKDLIIYLKSLKGKKIITFEESTASHWLYVSLKPFVDEVIVCDPYRNRLLREGAKNDKNDAIKLAQLLRGNMLKPVFHTGDEFIYLRKIVSGYEDMVKAGVRFKNQRSALFRAVGKDKREKTLEHPAEQFVLSGLELGLDSYELEKKRYGSKFLQISKQYTIIKKLQSIPGIGLINAVKIAAIVVDAKRFQDKSKFLAYCGLIKFDNISGGKVYGKRSPRCNRTLKGVFKNAVLSVLIAKTNNPLKGYYEFLIKEKNYPLHQARTAVTRKIAVFAYGVMKSGKELNYFGVLKQAN